MTHNQPRMVLLNEEHRAFLKQALSSVQIPFGLARLAADLEDAIDGATIAIDPALDAMTDR